MPLNVRPLTPGFVGEASGVDVRRPLDPGTVQQITAALDRLAVLVFHEQWLEDEQQIALSRQFGRVEASIATIRGDRRLRLPDREIADVSNLDADDRIRPPSDRWRMMTLANRLWHTDSSFKPIPGKLSFLSAREVPAVGGDTEFADLRAAYDALDASRRTQVEGLAAEHSIFHSRSLVGYTEFSDAERAALPPVARPLVRVHPGCGRKTLYLGSHAAHIVGWPGERGRTLLRELTAFATDARFVYRHSWRAGDLVIWDNRCTLHRGLPFDDAGCRRDLRRTTIEDDPEFATEPAAAVPVAAHAVTGERSAGSSRC
jgi:alpha-ketoglutarate-dependent 2,4-dichlorophenoxyacetate dioxygenase